MTESIYERIDIIFAGQSMTARPTDFEMDDQRNPTKPIKWETTCPGCGCAVPFAMKDVAVLDDKIYVCCPECKAGEKDKARVKADELSIAAAGQIIAAPKTPVFVDRGCPFFDPISLGSFRTDIESGDNPYKPEVPIFLVTSPVDNSAAVKAASDRERAKAEKSAVAEVTEEAAQKLQQHTEKVLLAAVAKKPAPSGLSLGIGAAPPDGE